MKTFLSLLAFAFGINIVFAMITYTFFRGQITNAVTFWDYIHYAIGSLTTTGTGDMVPGTDAVQMWTSIYVLVVWVYVFYVTLNRISDIRFGRFG
jgi:uncharacterized protein (DUF2062 family)